MSIPGKWGANYAYNKPPLLTHNSFRRSVGTEQDAQNAKLIQVKDRETQLVQ